MAEVEFIGSIDRLRYQADDSLFKIALMRVSEVLSGDLKKNKYDQVIFKGEMSLIPQNNYIIKGELIDDPKWGPQYQYISSKRKDPIENMSKEDFRIFLTDVSPKGVLVNQAFDDPRPIFTEHKIKELMSVKGIGPVNADKLINAYEEQKDFSEAYVEFGKWDFTPKMTRKLVRYSKSVENAIEILHKDPYQFMDVPGVGFKTIDEKAINFGIAANDPRRVHAFVKDYFDTLAMDGSSYTTEDKLIKYLEKEVFDCDIEETLKWVNKSREFVVYQFSNDKRIATKRLFDTEESIAENLVRLMSAENRFEYKDRDKIISGIQEEQGWKYSGEQMKAIDMMLDGNVTLLQGLAGTGKSTALNAVIKVLQANDYSVSTCALSGKAADNLTQITGKRGSTIHRMLGINEMGVFFNHETMPFTSDVVILDEVSMVADELFEMLVNALADGTKFIMVGDVAQLDSIGVGVMRSIIASNIVPTVSLTKIHRQAEDSAIITHSLAYRHGNLPQLSLNDNWKMKGNKKDLGYVFENSAEEEKLLTDAYKVFALAFKKYPVTDIQILTQTVNNTKKINEMAQKIANPKNPKKNQYTVFQGKEGEYVLREGDKVLNTANKYKTLAAENESVYRPIFNGNTGIIESIEYEYDKKGNIKDIEMIIDFDGIGRVLLKKNDVKTIQLGYAMTVHKSQGSTIPCVIVMLPFHFMLNTRELLYTALTRASDKCFLLTTQKSLKTTVKKTSETVHHSNLKMLLEEEFKNAENV